MPKTHIYALLTVLHAPLLQSPSLMECIFPNTVEPITHSLENHDRRPVPRASNHDLHIRKNPLVTDSFEYAYFKGPTPANMVS